jgi:hypothetical protein
VVLVVEGAGIGEIIDPAKHLDADTPVLGEIVFGAPAIFETEAVGLAVIADLRRKKRVEVNRSLPVPSSTIGPNWISSASPPRVAKP